MRAGASLSRNGDQIRNDDLTTVKAGNDYDPSIDRRRRGAGGRVDRRTRNGRDRRSDPDQLSHRRSGTIAVATTRRRVTTAGRPTTTAAQGPLLVRVREVPYLLFALVRTAAVNQTKARPKATFANGCHQVFNGNQNADDVNRGISQASMSRGGDWINRSPSMP